MKNILMMVLITGSFTLKAATYFCTEQTDPNDMRKERVSIEIKEVKDVTKPNSDYIYESKITLTTKIKGEISTIKKFKAYSNIEDVYYTVTSKENGLVDFYMYLDELNEAGIEYLNQFQNKVIVRLDCVITQE